MKFNGKEIKIVVSIITDEKLDMDFVKRFFKNEKVDMDIDETQETHKYYTVIFDSEISRENVNKLLFELSAKNIYFELTIESEEDYIYEVYNRNIGDDYLTKVFTDEKEKAKNGKEHLLNILFHDKKEQIKIEDLR